MRATMLRQAWAGLKLLVVLTVLLGICYPLAVWGLSRAPGLRHQAEGSIVSHNGHPVGSTLIGLNPVAADPAHDPFFHTRPSAQAHDYSTGDRLGLGANSAASSGGSNLAADSRTLLAQVARRRAAIAAREHVSPAQVPTDAVTASASGLDPDISPAYADLQAARVARVTGLPLPRVRRIVADHITGRPLAVLGEPTVNVLTLNLAIAHILTTDPLTGPPR